MHKLTAIALTAILFAACGNEAPKDSYVLKGTLAGIPDQTMVYLQVSDTDGLVLDSTRVTDNKFEFTGKIAEPAQAILAIVPEGRKFDMNGARNRVDFYIEPGNITVTSPDSLNNATVKGSITNDEKIRWDEMNSDITAVNKEWNEKMMKVYEETGEFPRDIYQEYMQVGDTLRPIEAKRTQEFFDSHPDSYFSLHKFYPGQVRGKTPDEMEEILNRFTPRLRDTKLGRKYANDIEKLRMVQIGAEAPDFTQNDPNGNPVKLSDFRGQYVLLDFWASWCGPCRGENPHVVAAYNAYKDKNFTVLGVSLDNPGKKDDWLKAIEDDNLTWTQVSDLQGWKNEASNLYSVRGIPANFLIDPDGIIVATNLRGARLEEKLAELLN